MGRLVFLCVSLLLATVAQASLADDKNTLTKMLEDFLLELKGKTFEQRAIGYFIPSADSCKFMVIHDESDDDSDTYQVLYRKSSNTGGSYSEVSEPKPFSYYNQVYREMTNLESSTQYEVVVKVYVEGNVNNVRRSETKSCTTTASKRDLLVRELEKLLN